MTAYRVVDDHKELENIGTHTHEEIDIHIDLTEFIVFSGSGNIPANARILKAGPGISILDSGPGGNLTIVSSGSGLTGPGGSTGQIQFNSSGTFGGTTGLSWNDATSTLTGTVVVASSGFTGSLTKLPDGSDYITVGTSSVMSQTGSVTVSTGSSGQVTIFSYVFPDNLTVSLPGGKTFGRYSSGSTIPAAGKTPAEVILMAIKEPINPTVTLSSSTTIAFNQTNIENSLTFGYVINSLDASVSSAILEWRRNNSGPWSTLVTDKNITSCDHILVDTNFNTKSFNYRYTVTDSLGSTATATLDITPQAYVSPSISLTVSETSSGSIVGETNLKREKGNVGSNITGVLTRNSQNVPINSYSVQFSTNGSSWNSVPGLESIPVSGNPSTVNIPSTIHLDESLRTFNTLYYRVIVTDSFQTTVGPPVLINFLDVIYYGTSATQPDDSLGVRTLTGRIFVDGQNTFNLMTGNVYNVFTIALPSSRTLTQVIDLDALNAVITNRYVLSTFSVDDAGGTLHPYNVYVMSNAIPYTSNHRHQVTRS